MRIRSVRLCLLACLVLAGLAAPRIKGYYHFVHYGPNAAADEATIEKFDLTALLDNTVYFYVSNQRPALAANDSYEALVSQVRQALAVWNNVPSSALRVGYGGISGGELRANSPAGEIIFAELPPGVIGLGGPVTRGSSADGFVPIVRSQVILSKGGIHLLGPATRCRIPGWLRSPGRILLAALTIPEPCRSSTIGSRRKRRVWRFCSGFGGGRASDVRNVLAARPG